MTTTTTDPALKKRVWGWMMFDWATQPFYTLGLTFIFGPYFAGVVAEMYMNSGLSETSADAKSQIVWAGGTAVSGLCIAILAPILGAYADSTGRRLPWLIGFSAVYIVASTTMWWMLPDASALWFCLFGFFIAMIAAEIALTFTNAILPSLGNEEEVGKISANGASFGYWGGLLALAIMLLFFFEFSEGKTVLGLSPPFGLDGEAREGTRFVGPFIAIWFVIFMIPYFMYVREGSTPNRSGGIRQALGDLKKSLKGVASRPSMLSFLGAAMLYQDALNALYSMGGVYARLVLDWGLLEIATFGIIGALSAAILTFVGGRFDRKYGPKPVIRTCVCILIVVCIIIVGMSRTSLLGIPLPEGSFIPDAIFYVCGSLIGGAGGALYAASRSMMVRHTDPERASEAFGLFALSGKATAFMAPALILLFTFVLENARLGYTPLIVMFILSLIVLRWVQPDGDRAEWSKSSIPAP
ncbi:MAG: MFS transporter [Planktomarina sp.]